MNTLRHPKACPICRRQGNVPAFQGMECGLATYQCPACAHRWSFDDRQRTEEAYTDAFAERRGALRNGWGHCSHR